MLKHYNRDYLQTHQDGENGRVLFNSQGKCELPWNQYIGQVIINDFIAQMEQYDGADFDSYIKDVVPYITLGLFQSAIMKIRGISDDNIGALKEWLITALSEGEDRAKWKISVADKEN